MSIIDEVCKNNRNSYTETYDDYQIIVKPYDFNNRKSIDVSILKDEATIGELQSHFEDGILFIRNVVVKENYQRSGMGRLLVRKSKEAAEKEGLLNCIRALRVYKESRDFWKRLGFRERGLDFIAKPDELCLQ